MNRLLALLLISTLAACGNDSDDIAMGRKPATAEFTQAAAKAASAAAADKVKREAEQTAKLKADAAACKAAKDTAQIGTTTEFVLKCAMGKPKRINTTTTAQGSIEQWVYPGGVYLTFANGRMIAIQN
jgi:hypothetical protein